MARAQVVLLQEDRILLARHERDGKPYWVLPGGAIDEHETPEGAAIRETTEETGLQVAIDRLLFVDEPRRNRDVIIRRPRYTYLAHLVGGDLRCPVDPESGNPGNGYLAAVEWMPFDFPHYDEATRDTLRRVMAALK